MEYTIKITGRGNREGLSEALRRLADGIKHPTSIGDGLNVPLEELSGEWGPHCELTVEVEES